MRKTRDKYGRVYPSAGYRNGELEPYIVEEAGDGVTYICYTDAARRAIRRITEATADEFFGPIYDDLSPEEKQLLHKECRYGH